MAKKQPKRGKPKPKTPTPTVAEIVELVRMGLVKVVTREGEDPVLVAIPDELQVPKAVDPETLSAEDRLLIEGRELPDRLDKLLCADSLALWRGFVRFDLLPLLQRITGKTMPQLVKLMVAHDVERMALAFVEQVMVAGFDVAIERYADQLKDVPELQRRRSTDAKKSRKANASKRKTFVPVGNRLIPRDERDALMAAEYAALLKVMKPTPACQQLAAKYGFDSWQGVRKAIEKFREREPL
jgi:hypothetical protein